MNELKTLVIEIFESKNENFKKGMIREFQKKDPPITQQAIYKYREILIYDILKMVSETNDNLLKGIENPMYLIEEILFTHINSN